MEEAEQKTDFDKIIKRVAALLAKAESSTHPGEKRVYQEKAEELIARYRIDEENLIATDQFSITPIKKTMIICPYGFSYGNWMSTLFSQVATHVGAKHALRTEKNDEGVYCLVGHIVGYDSDLRYAAILWQSIRLAFISSITPEVDPKLSDEENIYRLRSSGIARKDVAEKLWGKWTHSNSAKVGKIYKEECLRRGEQPALDGRGIDLKTFREVYAREFVYRVWDRLEDARNAVMQQGGLPELSGRRERVEEKFWEFFPEYRPRPEPETVVVVETPAEPVKKGRKRLDYTETKAYKERQRRLYDSPAAIAGARAGYESGNKVNISRTAGRTERLGYESAGLNDSKELEQ